MTGESLDHANVFFDGDTVCYRASALGSCVRALVAARMGMQPMEPPESFKLRFADGHLHEGAVLDGLKEHIDVRDSQESITILVDPGVEIRGHMDATGYGRLDDWEWACGELPPMEPNNVDDTLTAVIEVKALAISTFDSWTSRGFSAFPKYADQISLYMSSTGLPALFCVKNKNNGQMSFTWVVEPPSDVEALKEKVRLVERLVEAGDLPDCSQRDYPCPYWYLCTDREMLPDQTVVDASIDALALTYERKRALVKVAEAAQREARDRLREVMGDRQRVETAAYKVGLTSRKGGFDYERLFADHPEIDREQYRKDSTEYMTVTAKEKKDE